MAIKQKVISFLYRKALKPILFKFDAEDIHDIFINLGEFIGSNSITRLITRSLFSYHDKSLEQNILGIRFLSPIGLAAGFDYNARLIRTIEEVGFSHTTIGSVTRGSYEGNPKPRLSRLPLSKSLWVNKGLKNIGAENIISRIKKINYKINLGVSIAKTNCSLTVKDDEGIKDYVSCLKLFNDSNIGNYYEINISCPNTFGGEPFTTSKKLERLLSKIDKLKIKKPIFLKMPIDLSISQTKSLCDVASNHKVDGLIFGNLTKDRGNEIIKKSKLNKLMLKKGAFSGLPTRDLSNKLIAFAYKNYKKRFVIIGCGGVFSASDAYGKIKLGATLIQMITGMIFQGPQVIGEINQGLVKLLKEDGYKNIREAIGVENK